MTRNWFHNFGSKIDSKIDSKFDPKIDSKIDPKIDPKIDSKIDPEIDSKIDPKFDSKIVLGRFYFPHVIGTMKWLQLLCGAVCEDLPLERIANH